MGRCANHLPEALASVLVKISRIAEGLPNDTAEGHTTTAPLFIFNPLSGRGMDNLFYLSISSLPLGSSAALVSIKSANFPPAKPCAGAKCLRCAYLPACSSMKRIFGLKGLSSTMAFHVLLSLSRRSSASMCGAKG